MKTVVVIEKRRILEGYTKLSHYGWWEACNFIVFTGATLSIREDENKTLYKGMVQGPFNFALLD